MRSQYTDMYRAGNILAVGEGTHDRLALGNLGAIATQTVYLTFFTAQISELINSVTVSTGGSGWSGTAPTLCKMGLYHINSDNLTSNNLNLLWSTTNDTSMWGTANTQYTKTLVDPSNGQQAWWHKMRGVRYAFSVICVTTGTPPTFVGVNLPFSLSSGLTSFINEVPRVASVYNTGPPSDFPSTINDSALSGSAIPKVIYAEFKP